MRHLHTKSFVINIVKLVYITLYVIRTTTNNICHSTKNKKPLLKKRQQKEKETYTEIYQYKKTQNLILYQHYL